VFATAALRDAAIVSPQVGQVCVITVGTAPFTGVTAPGEYIYCGATDKWQQPWNSSWGEQIRTVDVTAQTNADNTEHVIAAAATALTAVANRLYRIRVEGSWENLLAGAANITLKVKDGVTLIEQARVLWIAATTAAGSASFVVEIGTLTAGAHTINVTHQSSSASGVTLIASTTPLVITIDDIGPSGAPS
jgi:hypothetical protein